ncbi:MAG TPA: hypothetical protein VGT02_14325 [Methylomirabilota bacterium]|jgi:hypothetical protein|nr:hypothetical protein [Methylomirabilota bacterium]
MRRSRTVDVPLVMRVAATAILLGCGSDHRLETQRCVTRDWEVVPDTHCDAEPTRPGYAPVNSRYLWYYGGHGTNIGERVTSGSTVPPANGLVTRPNSGGYAIAVPGGASTRGGFGSTASVSSGGRSGTTTISSGS